MQVVLLSKQNYLLTNCNQVLFLKINNAVKDKTNEVQKV